MVTIRLDSPYLTDLSTIPLVACNMFLEGYYPWSKIPNGFIPAVGKAPKAR
jgi:hypothetical protein